MPRLELDAKPRAKALGLPFICLSTSEPEQAFRKFQTDNFGNLMLHQHEFMDHQTKGCKCCLHPDMPGCSVPVSPRVAVFGTPCPPFSKMRTKRFTTGSQEHQMYAVTFQEWFDWALQMEPITGIGEQVLGFASRESPDDTSSPLERRVDAWGFLHSDRSCRYLYL